jgi:hypothetical protein
MSDEEPDGQCGLSPIALTDQSIVQSAFSNLAQPVSDYSFASVYIWRSALRLWWTRRHQHVCLFANGFEDLTMLAPPVPEPGATTAGLRRALEEAFEIMDAYNAGHDGACAGSRIEYVSDEMLERVSDVCGGGLRLSAGPMSGDYLYAVGDMIDLPGGAFRSKRRLRLKFLRDTPDWRTAPLGDEHTAACLELLDVWQRHADAKHEGQTTEDDRRTQTAVLRRRETSACELALMHREQLSLTGMALYSGPRLVGFTLGERLSPAQASIVIEKTHPECEGAPQFIFSEFCRQCWRDYPEINVGDDWGIPTLRFTKESYHPCRRLNKYVLTRPAPAARLISVGPRKAAGHESDAHAAANSNHSEPQP